MDKEKFGKETMNILTIVAASILSAVGLWVFVYPASFAPAGVDGISTMLQEITGINAGIFSFLINLPLLITAWFVFDKRYVIYTIIYTVLNSGLLLLFEAIHFYQYTDINPSGYLIAAGFSGVMMGIRTGMMLKIGGSTGGVDIMAGLIQIKTTFHYIERVMSILCAVIIGVSFFLYRDINCILLSIVQLYVSERAINAVLKDNRNAIEFKIITKHPDEIRNDIIHNIKHGATVIESRGMYTGDKSALIITVINIRQITEFVNLIKKYPNTFLYYSEVLGVKGNFRYGRRDVVK